MNTKMNLVTINGPLGCGKTWTVDRISAMNQNVIFHRVSWQDSLKKAAMALLGVPIHFSYDLFKKTDYYGKTGRQWMIDLSEGFVKQHDPLFFSKVMHSTMQMEHANHALMTHKKHVFIADSNGFENELDYFRVQEDVNLLACSIEPLHLRERRGLPWIDGDSRFNLAAKCTLVAEDSTEMLGKLNAALQRRNWI